MSVCTLYRISLTFETNELYFLKGLVRKICQSCSLYRGCYTKLYKLPEVTFLKQSSSLKIVISFNFSTM